MTDFSPFKKIILSFGCAFLLLIYVPVAAVVGNDIIDERELAKAETTLISEEETIELPEETAEYIYNN
ncbi:MAG: hypothetical protein E7535_08080 [Ruminococcaceae bacterium]|nr:hypothetical protein [Oscillospiraceae bacterium]